MKADTVPTGVQQHHSPEAISALTTLTPDYVDLFSVTVGGGIDASPEQWARAALEGASRPGRFFVWQILCGLRLETRPSPDHVAGWKIVERGDGWIRLEASSWFMTVQAVVQIEDDRASIALFVRYDRSVAVPIWSTLSVAHRRLMPGLLRNAARQNNRRR